MKWTPTNIISGVSIANQRPAVPQHFNTPLMIIRAPYWQDKDQPKRFYTISLNDGYCMHAGPEGVGLTAEELAAELMAEGYFPVSKIVTERSIVMDQPENRLEVPAIVITNSHA